MPAASRERSIGLAQFIAIVAVAVVVFLGWDFGRRVLDTMRLLEEDRQAEIDLRTSQKLNQDLKDLKGRVMSDDWIEQRARNDWHWTKEGETILVPIATPVPGSSTPAAAPASPPPPPAKPFWREWLDAIFGPAP